MFGENNKTGDVGGGIVGRGDDESSSSSDDDGEFMDENEQDKKKRKLENRHKIQQILHARRIAHVKARDALQEFLRQKETKLVDILGNGEENPVYLMMRLVQQRQAQYETGNKYEQAKQCAAVAQSLEQLVMQAKPLSYFLLEILEALQSRKDHANSLSLSFRHSDRLQVEFQNYEAWLLKKFKAYSHCIDLIRYGSKETQNRQLVMPFAKRKGVSLTRSDLVRSIHEKTSSICTTFNKYGQVHGKHYVYKFSYLKELGVIRELRLITNNDNAMDDTSVLSIEKLTATEVKNVKANLDYKFNSRDGIFEVACVYKQLYVIDMVRFQVMELQKTMKMGDAAFEPKGSHTSYGTADLLKLVESMTMKSLLLWCQSHTLKCAYQACFI